MQYTIVFLMKFIITLSFALSCIHILNRYSMSDTALGNTGRNIKPISSSLFDEVKEKFKDIDKESLHRDDPDVVTTITKYITTNIDRIKENYKLDAKYSMDNVQFMTDKEKKYINSPNFHRISDVDNKYFINQIIDKKLDLLSPKLQENIVALINADSTIEKKAIEHFIRHAKNLVRKGILFEKPSAAAMAQKLSSIKNTIPEKKFLLRSTHGSMDIDATVSVDEASNMLKKFIKISGNNMLKDTKDNMYTHMSLFGILLIICSVTLALCVAATYHIAKNKHQSDISYSIGLM